MRQAGLDRDVEILGRQPQHAVHARQVDRDAAGNGIDVGFERAAHPEWNDWHAGARARRDDCRDFVVALRKHHRIRWGARMP